MIIFLTQAEKPQNIELFQSDKRFLLQLVMPMAELVSKVIYAQQSTEFTQVQYISSMAQEVLVMFHNVFG